MNFRDMFVKVFGNKQESPQTVTLKTLNGYAGNYSMFSGDIYNDDTVRACIDTIARHFAKLKAVHVRNSADKRKPISSRLNQILSVRANELMSSYDFTYKIISQLYINNNAFVYIRQDDFGDIVSLWPLDYQDVELREDKAGNIYCVFTFGIGGRKTVPYDEIIHLRRHFGAAGLWGDSQFKVLQRPLGVLQTIKDGWAVAVKNSGVLRGLLKYVGTLQPDDLKLRHDRFVNEYMDTEKNGSRVGTIDSTAEYQELKADYKMASADQMKLAKGDIYRLFGVSEKIIQGSFNEEEYIAFYEHVIEPLAIQISQEFTAKLFTEKEKGHGNEVYFESNRLSYASTKTKVAIMASVGQQGVLTINEIRNLFGWSPVEDGEERLVSLNYIKAQHQDVYQLLDKLSEPKGVKEDEDGNEGDDI